VKIRSYGQVVRERVDQLTDLRVRVEMGEDVRLFIPTGLAAWDRNGGLERGVLTVIGGSSGEGKSFLKLHLASSAARAGFKVLILDFEDPAAKTADRTLSMLTGINSREIGMLRFPTEDVRRLQDAADEAQEWGDRIVHVEGLLTVQQVRDLLTAHDDAELVLLDYFQGLPEESGENYERTLANLAWDLNKDAQDNGRGVVAFSQLIDDVEVRGDSRAEWSVRKGAQSVDLSGYRPGPGRKDLGRCRALGERCKQLWYFWRPGRHARKWGVPGAKDNLIELVGDKVNFAGEGRFRVGFDPATARLYDLKETNDH
jgi:replicative DNA helicase